ncbi:MerR family transcriptional regulator [Stella sp.]|uniref:MerR family transcriptional regulator n=1 Tax=Stella sp. TaxID=2912054 RepID=UPI0035B327BE
MNASAPFLSPAEAAQRLGVSTKALRVYEERGLLAPLRTAAGWRAYGPDEMARAQEIAALRRLGLSVAEVGRVLGGDATDLEPALAAHQAVLEERIGELAGLVGTVRDLRRELSQGRAPAVADLDRQLRPAGAIAVDLDLPWPWDGERFELHDVRPITFIVGPLGSGKTRLARGLAEAIPGASFLGTERAADGAGAARARIAQDPALRLRVERALGWLVGDGATVADALLALVAGLEAEGPTALVVDMVEEGLDHASQEALIAHLRRRRTGGRPLFLLTRSTAILDLAAVGADEAILLCPANHSPPMRVAPWPGAPGYEAVATCLAAPAVRARTAGTIAWRPAPAPAGRPEGRGALAES